jgi:SAM-dependent methyltransferase
VSGLATPAGAAAWHDVECASYAADLPLWRELCTEHPGAVLDLGCGTGRVALDLARLGHAVTAIDAEARLVAALAERARAEGLGVRALAGDARSLSLDCAFALAIAPMQVVQLLGGSPGRRSMLASVCDHLAPGGVAAIALADPFDAVPAGEALPPLPDVLECDGWVLSSTPLAVRDQGDAVAIDRRRQAVSPTGELTEEVATIVLDAVSRSRLEAEAAQAGLRALAPRRVPATRDYVASTVVMLEAAT